MLLDFERWIAPRALGVLTLLLVAGLPSLAAAQDTTIQPAETMREQHEVVDAPQGGNPNRLPSSYEAPPLETTVRAGLRETERIGSYAQPRWTARRRFPLTRTYVVPAGTSTFEWWYDQKLSLENTKNVRHRSLWEFEFGLGYRLQLDLYLRLQQEGWAGPIEINEEKVELRWAIMDWGCIPGNPTLYVEFNRAHNEPSQLELKLLLGDEITRRLHWGVNFGVEHQLGGEYANEYTAVGALSYTLVDSIFSAGLEVLFQPVDVQGDRFSWGKNYEFLAGPSLQWRPTKAMHIDLVLPFGYEIETAEGAKATTPLFHWTTVIGWEF